MQLLVGVPSCDSIAAALRLQVPKVAAALAPGAAKIPTGQAIVTDTQLPGQILSYSGTHPTAGQRHIVPQLVIVRQSFLVPACLSTKPVAVSACARLQALANRAM